QALAGDAHAGAGLDAGGDLDLQPAGLAAVLGRRHLQDPGRAAVGLFQRDLDRVLHVQVAGPGPSAAAAEEAGEDVAAVAEEVSRVAAEGIGAEGRTRGAAEVVEAAAAPLGLHALDLVGVLPVLAVAVVLAALFRVGEDVVGGVHLLEARLGRLVAGVDVGVKLAGKAAVRRADVLLAGVAVNAQYLVVVPGHRRLF